MRRIAAAGLIAGALLWALWPADPQAWRRAELAEVVQRPQWRFFIDALKQGDEEALARVVPLLPLIKDGDHLEEELHGALIESLAAQPVRTLEVFRAGGLPLETICYESTRKTLQSLAALVDAGFGEAAQRCLTVMSTRGPP